MDYKGDLSAWCKISSSSAYANPLCNGAKLYLNGSELTDITIPSDITEIKNDTFWGCTSLTSVTIGNSVTSIGHGAFMGCTSLTSVTIPDSVTSIGNSAFSSCTSLTAFYGKFASKDNRCLIVNGVLRSVALAGITSYTIPDSVTSIGSSAFFYCTSLTSVTIPDSVTSIGVRAFDHCSSLESVTIPDTVTSIGHYAFLCCSSVKRVDYKGDLSAWCKISFEDGYDHGYANPLCNGAKLYLNGSELTDITIPSDITEIKDDTFWGCTSLTSVAIPDTVTSIGSHAFRGCTSLTSVAIPDSVTVIRWGTFRNCSSLTSITIGNSVTSIQDYAFNGCRSLTSVYCKATTPPTGGGGYMFGENASGRKIYVPTASVDAYKSAVYWSNYASDIVGYDF